MPLMDGSLIATPILNLVLIAYSPVFSIGNTTAFATKGILIVLSQVQTMGMCTNFIIYQRPTIQVLEFQL